MLTRSTTLAAGAPGLLLVARRRGMVNPDEPSRLISDQIDPGIRSPKSVRFGPDSDRLYLQALEGSQTLTFSQDGLSELARISHRFGSKHADLFASPPPEGRPRHNQFAGKPVESELTHGGRYLWVPYYRRSFDEFSREDSAMALIDTRTQQIIRVFATGSISKGVRASRDGKWLAVSHWGDNTIGLWDISGDDPIHFRQVARLAAAPPLKLEKIRGDRDVNCGLCVRGLEFSADSSRLWVTAMRGGFVAEFDITEAAGPDGLIHPIAKYQGLGRSPRDIELTSDGKHLLASCARTGLISRVDASLLMAPSRVARSPAAAGYQVPIRKVAAESIRLSGGVRSLRISPDDQHVYAAIHGSSRIGVIRNGAKLEVEASIPTDPFPVGLDISPDGNWLAVSAQGMKGKGGDSLSIYRVLGSTAQATLSDEEPAELGRILE